MKYLINIVLFCFSFSPLFAIEHAIKFVITDTSVQYGKQSIAAISEQANVSLFKTQVNGLAHIDGNLNASRATLSDVVVNGSATLSDCTISGSISVYGELQLHNCQVTGQVSTYALYLLLDNTTAGSILVLNGQDLQQTVELRHKSLINSSITFEQGSGTLNLWGGSYYAGTLTGGSSIRK